MVSSKTTSMGESTMKLNQGSQGSKKVDTYMDPEFWYHKGVVLNKKDQGKKGHVTPNSASAHNALKCYM